MRILLVTIYVLAAGVGLSGVCSCSRPSGLPANSGHGISVVAGSPLANTETGLAYDTHFRIGKHRMSGVMYLRQTDPGIWRVALAAKIGQTLFDIEIRPDTMIVHRVIDELKRNIVLTWLERDLRLITGTYPNPERIDKMDSGAETAYYRLRVAGKKSWVHITGDKTSGEVNEIALGGKRLKKSIAQFTDYTNGTPGRIAIDHRTIISFEIRMQRVLTAQQQP